MRTGRDGRVVGRAMMDGAIALGREHNWADNHTFVGRVHRPDSVDEVRRLVAGAARVRALGTRHSFNDLADSPGDLIDVGAIPPDFAVDAERRTVTVGGGTRYGALAAYLHGQGLALHNMGSLPHISVAGATATGTHGSGDRNGSLSTAVAALELVTADGSLVTVRRGEPGFDGMVVGLGAFGVVTRLTLDVQPTFDVRQDAFADVPWDVFLARFDEIMASAYSVSAMTPWSGDSLKGLWLKTRLDHSAAQAITADRLGGTLSNHVVNILADTDNWRLTNFGTAGPWSERLPHFLHDDRTGIRDQIQSEYMVPRARAVEALTALRAISGRIDALLRLTELRTVAADALWLSSAYGGDAVAIHFTWRREPAAVGAITAEIEDMLIGFGGRPHWGKLIHAEAARLAPLYPRLDDFRALATRLDPVGKFRNAFLDRHVFG